MLGLKLANACSTRRSASSWSPLVPASVRRRSFSICSCTPTSGAPEPPRATRVQSWSYTIGWRRIHSVHPENDSHAWGRSAGGIPCNSAAFSRARSMWAPVARSSRSSRHSRCDSVSVQSITLGVGNHSSEETEGIPPARWPPRAALAVLWGVTADQNGFKVV